MRTFHGSHLASAKNVLFALVSQPLLGLAAYIANGDSVSSEVARVSLGANVIN